MISYGHVRWHSRCHALVAATKNVFLVEPLELRQLLSSVVSTADGPSNGYYQSLLEQAEKVPTPISVGPVSDLGTTAGGPDTPGLRNRRWHHLRRKRR